MDIKNSSGGNNLSATLYYVFNSGYRSRFFFARPILRRNEHRQGDFTMKHSARIAIGALFFLVTFATHAATVSLTPLLFSGSPGSQTASTDVMADFGSTLVQEGAFGVVWPDALGAPTFSFNDSITT